MVQWKHINFVVFYLIIALIFQEVIASKKHDKSALPVQTTTDNQDLSNRHDVVAGLRVVNPTESASNEYSLAMAAPSSGEDSRRRKIRKASGNQPQAEFSFVAPPVKHVDEHPSKFAEGSQLEQTILHQEQTGEQTSRERVWRTLLISMLSPKSRKNSLKQEAKEIIHGVRKSEESIDNSPTG